MSLCILTGGKLHKFRKTAIKKENFILEAAVSFLGCFDKFCAWYYLLWQLGQPWGYLIARVILLYKSIYSNNNQGHIETLNLHPASRVLSMWSQVLCFRVRIYKRSESPPTSVPNMFPLLNSESISVKPIPRTRGMKSIERRNEMV